MLNEKITVTIGGRNYKLVTDNSKILLAAAEKIDKKMEEYCTANIDLRRDDAAVYSALEISNDLCEAEEMLSSASAEITRLKAVEEKATASAEENKKLKADSDELKKLKTEFEKLSKRFSELESKNEQLSETLKTANEKAAESDKLKSKLSEAERSISDLKNKNADLSKEASNKAAETEKQKKTVSEKDKRITELTAENKKAVKFSEENKRLLEKLEKTKNFEEAFNREKSRADKAEADAVKQKEQNEKLSKENSENALKISDLENKLKSKTASADDYKALEAMYDELEKSEKDLRKQLDVLSKDKNVKANAELRELKAKYSQLESENAALKAADNNGGELEAVKEQITAIKARNEKLTKQVKTLKKENTALEKQLKEAQEDGQLTL